MALTFGPYTSPCLTAGSDRAPMGEKDDRSRAAPYCDRAANTIRELLFPAEGTTRPLVAGCTDDGTVLGRCLAADSRSPAELSQSARPEPWRVIPSMALGSAKSPVLPVMVPGAALCCGHGP